MGIEVGEWGSPSKTGGSAGGVMILSRLLSRQPKNEKSWEMVMIPTPTSVDAAIAAWTEADRVKKPPLFRLLRAALACFRPPKVT